LAIFYIFLAKTEAGIQTDEFDIIFCYLNVNKLLDDLANQIYQETESELVNKCLSNNLLSKPAASILIIPDSPLQKQAQLEVSLLGSEKKNKPSSFRERLHATMPNELSLCRKSQINNQRKKPPTLEFVSSARKATVSDTLSAVASARENENSESSDESDKSLSYNTIIEETPVKMNKAEIEFLAKRLSVTVNRMQAVFDNETGGPVSTSAADIPPCFDGSFVNRDAATSASSDFVSAKTHKSQEQEERYEDAAEEPPTIIFNTEPPPIQIDDEISKQARSKPALVRVNPNNSFFLNTFRSTIPVADSTNISTSVVDSRSHLAPPPAAREILGVSLVSGSEFNISILESNTLNNTSRIVLPTDSELQPSHLKKQNIPKPIKLEPENSDVSFFTSKPVDETQSLTDTTIVKIENICRDLYSYQNSSVMEPPAPSAKNTSNEASLKNSSDRKLEFVFSLLSAEMKVCI
jgi:hypothetical protein